MFRRSFEKFDVIVVYDVKIVQTGYTDNSFNEFMADKQKFYKYLVTNGYINLPIIIMSLLKQ